MFVNPDPAGWTHQLFAVAAVGSWLAALSLLALWVRDRWPHHREWSRKLVHIGTGPVVLIAWWLGIDRAIAVPAAAGVTLIAALNHRFRLLPAVEDVDRHSYGTVAYGTSFTLLLWIWWPARPDAVAAGVLVMAIGDGLAGLLGPTVPSPSWSVLGERRSLAGTATMGIAGLAALAATALLPGSQPPAAAALLLVAAAATALEQVPLLGIDNLTVPLAVAWLWTALG
ncbi:dolichol kinase [Cyanobium sp. FGCU-52]|nr:dolichol kinase [Cyanobium sp. FGCU52]